MTPAEHVQWLAHFAVPSRIPPPFRITSTPASAVRDEADRYGDRAYRKRRGIADEVRQGRESGKTGT